MSAPAGGSVPESLVNVPRRVAYNTSIQRSGGMLWRG